MIVKSVIKNAIMLILVGAVLAIIVYVGGADIRDSRQCILSVIDKEQRLASIVSPKVVLVGGSNWAFGIDSKQISKTVNMPVVNLGIHAGLGLDFMLKEAHENIKKGDIVFLSTEYFLKRRGEIKLHALLYDTNPNVEKYCTETINDKILLRVINIQRIVSGLFYKYISKIPTNTELFNRKQFSAEGDMLGHLEAEQPQSQAGRDLFTVTDYSSNIELMNDFIEYAQNQGASVYYLFPCYSKTQYELNKIAIHDFEKQLRNKLTCRILNTPQNFLFNDEYLYDTVYHLNKKGREIRTQIMCALLNEAKIRK